MRNKLTIHLFVFCLLVFPGRAAIKLPAILSNNMVLQQQSQVKLWGTAKSNSKVSVHTSWNNKTYKVQSDQGGKWSVMVQTPSAGGPYSITFNDGNKLALSNILIGEVWVCSGQSNMNMPMLGFRNQPILNANEILLDSENTNIRLFEVGRTPALTPQADCIGEWNESDAVTAGNFSAMAFQFGKLLQERLKVPIGLIHASIGGTKIQTWMNKDDLSQFVDVKLPSSFANIRSRVSVPTANYNGMIAPIAGFGIKGFIWYQGEANYKEPALYEKLFPAMVKGWREKWNMDTLPFYYVQIAPFARPETLLNAKFMEVQANALKMIPYSGMVTVVDVGKEHEIHPPDKTIPAFRLACLALAKTYGIRGISYCGPVIDQVKMIGDHAILSFKYADKGLTSFDKKLREFEIAGEDRCFHLAKATILSDGTLEVYSEKVKKIVAVRYAFKNWVVGDLYNTAGLPAIPFRTDDWD